jgi:hypothetical protein
MPYASDLAGYLQTGSTLPATPFAGRLWLQVATGRSWLMHHDGSVWRALAAFGTTTLYVNGSSGSNSPGQGTGTGANAYATLQYAIDQLPTLLYGNVTIYLASGTYREMVTIAGKFFAGAYTLLIEGFLSTLLGTQTATSGANPAANGAAGWGTITKTGAAFPSYAGKWVELMGGTGAGQLRVIHANTATTLTIVGRWDTVPDASTGFAIREPGTRITGSDAAADTTAVRPHAVVVKGMLGVQLRYLTLDYCTYAACAALLQGQAEALGCQMSNSVYGCWWDDSSTGTGAEACVVASNQLGILISGNARVARIKGCRIYGLNTVTGIQVDYSILSETDECYLNCVAAGAWQLYAVNYARVGSGAYCEYEGNPVVPTSHNLFANAGALIECSNLRGAWATQVSRSAGGWGAYADAAAQIYHASQITYSGNSSGTRTPTTGLSGGTT